MDTLLKISLNKTFKKTKKEAMQIAGKNVFRKEKKNLAKRFQKASMPRMFEKPHRPTQLEQMDGGRFKKEG